MLSRLLAALVLVALPAGTARADGPGCGEPLARWAASCAARTEAHIAVDHCADGVAVLVVEAGGPALRVELRGAGDRDALVTAHGLSASPVGEFPDWSAAPPTAHAAFDAVATCLRTGAPRFEAPSGESATMEERLDARAFVLPVALVAWLALVVLQAPRRRWLRDVAWALGTGAIAAAWWLFHAVPAFFHQNGHGPEWVAYARCVPSPYGPGYAAVFRPAALAAGVAAEQGVLTAQLGLASLAVMGIYVVGRRAGLRALVAASLALALSLPTIASRIVRSESYFATIASLLVLALAALSIVRARRLRPGWLAVGAGVVAGVLAAIAATVHPVAWIPAALVPGAVLVARASRAQRLRAASVATGAVVVVALVAALPAAHAVLTGPLGVQWGAAHDATRLFGAGLAVALPWAVCALSPGRAVAAWTVPLAVVGAAALAEASTVLFSVGDPHAPAAASAWRLLFVVVALPGIAALLRRATSLRRVPSLVPAIALLVAGVAASVIGPPAYDLPTDANEAGGVAPWLRALPPSARLAYVGRVGERVASLPLYRGCGLTPATLHALSLASATHAPIDVGDYWLHGSLCSTREGRPICDAYERRVVLGTLHRADVAARASLPPLDYDRPFVPIVLYRVTALRE